MRLWPLASSVFGALLMVPVACGSDESATAACVAGTTIACACPRGVQGVQICLPDGTGYGSCEYCEDASGGVGGSSAGGSAPGGWGGPAGSGGGHAGAATGGGGGAGGDGAEGGEGGEGGAGGVAGGGGEGPFQCIDLTTLSPKVDFPGCNVLDQDRCLCEGCVDDGICFSSQSHFADDCVCPDCVDDSYCSDPTSCNHDAVCDPYFEGCGCADCAEHPSCP